MMVAEAALLLEGENGQLNVVFFACYGTVRIFVKTFIALKAVQ